MSRKTNSDVVNGSPRGRFVHPRPAAPKRKLEPRILLEGPDGEDSGGTTETVGCCT